MSHFYPAQLARFVREQWCRACLGPSSEVPPSECLEDLLSICYQASLLTEELRPVTFRVVVLPPEAMASDDGPPRGYHRIRFSSPRPLDPNNLRKLSPAVEYGHSLLGIQRTEETFQIWGIVQSGTRWLTSSFNGRRPYTPLPSTLVVSVTGPGSINVSNGSVLVAQLNAGQIIAPGPEVLSSDWLQEVFQGVRQELENTPISACEACPPTAIDPAITRHISQGMIRRTLQLLRTRGHGGTLIIVPPDMAPELEKENPYVTVRFRFLEEEPRRRYRTLLLQVLRRLARRFPPGSTIGWSDYHGCEDTQLSDLDEALEEFAHLLASLAQVDGAVLLTHRLELVGFGVEIAGHLPQLDVIHQAHDVEATLTTAHSTENVGTRHRSAYRLCAQLPAVIALILSQDGRIQVVKQLHDRLTCWDQLSTDARDI